MGRTERDTAAAIERWFALHARDLPWRRDRTPWRSLVSEFMLQQTQVMRVLERFEAFMRRFPSPRDLAEADEQDVMHMWQGLGYYRRARNLQMAAREIVRKHCGEVPLDVSVLRTLPGVGRYTAGSMASIVGGHPEPIVDGNVSRLLARLHCDDGAAEDAAFANRMWARAGALVECCGSPALLNEGMMELGARICVPATPLCHECPLKRRCAAKRSRRQHEIPRPKRRAASRVIHHHAVVIRRRGRWLVQKRPPGGLWGGLWQAPAIEDTMELGVKAVVNRISFPVVSAVKIETLTRKLTHRTVHLHVHAGELRKGARVPSDDSVRWARQTDLRDMAFSSAARAVLAVISE
ncbi:MAG: A/G-specific adenine glycosylase [Planctomycetes bacterium]|nr:A/G-specific adenine glycosylase [Planctomycetota bacterium]MCP4839520.1 A/G-specific adenine glycosylase [Planctomycetota bacterium]